MNEKAPGYLDALEGTILKQKEENLLLVERVKELSEALELARRYLPNPNHVKADYVFSSDVYINDFVTIECALKGGSTCGKKEIPGEPPFNPKAQIDP